MQFVLIAILMISGKCGEEFRFDAGCSRQSSAQSKELYNYVWNEFFMKEINFGM